MTRIMNHMFACDWIKFLLPFPAALSRHLYINHAGNSVSRSKTLDKKQKKSL